MAGRSTAAVGLPGPYPIKGTLMGGRHVRYVLPPGASVLDPLDLPFQADEKSCLRTTEISKMKGQGLVCSQNAKLIAVNLRYIAYAMKEGTVRIINQNGKDLFKLHNSTKAVIADMAINGTGAQTDQGTTLLCVDEAARVTIFILEAHSSGSSEERAKRIELVFPSHMDPPQRVLGHPTDSKLFVTVHANHLGVWSLQLLQQEDPQESSSASGFFTHSVTDRLLAKCSMQYRLPHLPDLGCAPRVCDAAVSLAAQCLVALAGGTLFVWRLEDPGSWQEKPQLLQKFWLGATSDAVDGSEMRSLRILGPSASERQQQEGGEEEAEVLVVGSDTGCELFAHRLTPASSLPVGALLQSISLVSSSGEKDLVACIDANHIENDSLGIAFRYRTLVLVLPLARGWADRAGSSPFPYAQRFITEEPANQLSIMSGKSYQTAGHTLFMYRAHNFTREKDKLLGCNIAVSEVEDASLVAREEVSAGDAAAGTVADGVAAAEAAKVAEAAVAPEVLPGAEPKDAWPAEAPEGAPPGAPEAAEEQAGPVPNGPAAAAEQVPNGAGGAEPASAFDIEAAAAAAPAVASQEPRAPSPSPPEDAAPPPPPPPPAQHNRMPEPTADRAAAPTGGGCEDAQDRPPPPPKLDGPPEPAAEDAAAAAEAGECEEGDAAAIAGASTELGSSSRSQPGQERASDRTGVDRGFVKQIAASFVHGLEKKRGEMASRLLKEVSEAMKTGASGSASASDPADAAILEQALAAVREARDAQATCERNLQSAARKATDSWAEASATAVATLLQKELGKISDGVAATLAQQLSQSKKFCEALARGVQKSGSAVTKVALEGLRPPKQLQETVGNALTEALQESLAPVFKSELRLHFEQELAPLIGQRIGEMMASFRDRMGKCLESIASEHELAGQRLGRELAPIVADELRQVERVVQQSRPPASSGEISEAQLDELAQAVQVEIVQPLQGRIQDLTAQVESLREEARRLEDRWQTFQREQAAARLRPSDSEERQARELEGLFQEGKVVDAFIKAMHLQAESSRCDFLGRLCSLVPEGGLEDWLAGRGDGGPLSQQVKMLLMLSLSRQLEGADLDDEARAKKIEWITELWFAFDPADASVAGRASAMLAQLSEALDGMQLGGCGSETAAQLRRLKKAVQQYAKLLRDKP